MTIRSNSNYLLLFAFCGLDILLPFLGFFVLLERHWPLITAHTPLTSQGWLIAPTSILLLVAIVYIYITTRQFPTTSKLAWRLLRSVLTSLAVLLVSSGVDWRAGLFQYSLLEFLALAAAFGVVLLRQRSVIGWLFGLPALGWSIMAAWVSYSLYVATFLVQLPWLYFVLWPLWLLAAVPLLKTRYHFLNDFFANYYAAVNSDTSRATK